MNTTQNQTSLTASCCERLPHVLLGVFAVFWVALAIKPLYRQDWLLENLLVFIIVPILVCTYPRFRLSNLSYILTALYLMMHAIGAHYTYSEVPIGNWLRDGWQLDRNHYDRVVHFVFGLFMAYVLWEVLVRWAKLRGAWSYLIAPHLILAWSAAYEMIEALAAHIVNPELGAAYNGIQGDIWDSQKDMFLAMVGALLCMAIAAAAQGFVGLRGKIPSAVSKE